MGFSMSMFSAQSSPIAIDFGSSSVKLMQATPGEPPSMLAAVGLRIPDALRAERDLRFDFLEKQLPRMLRKGGFKGRRVICSIPSSDTLIQHMQIADAPGIDREETVKMQLSGQRGMSPNGMVVRTYFVTEVHRDGEPLSEVICFAISRDAVMRYVELLRKCKLETVGVHSEIIGMVRAFDHMQPPPDQPVEATLYVDVGCSSTNVAITHGAQMVFARCIQIGGQHLDEKLAERLGCDVATARAQRISEQVLADGAAPDEQGGAAVGVAESPDEVAAIAGSIAEELSMCARYHHSLFRDQQINKIVFLGGEARNITLCQHIARELRLPAQLGDPLARFEHKRSLRTPGLALGQPQPGWAVVCGLCTAPTDL
jgi:Tfp pilus assembly PilM family ATPase